MKRIFTWLFTVACVLSMPDLFGQGIGLNSTGAAPALSAQLDMASSTQGFLAPRMSKAQRIAISSPATGLLVYQNDVERGFFFFDGLIWQAWLKPRSGSVSMGLSSSTITKGQGYSVTHVQEGRDQITFSSTYTSIPDIALTAEGLPGVPPAAPFDYCYTAYSNCNDVHVSFIRLKTLIGISTNMGSVFMETGVTACNPVSFNYSFYNLSHSAYTTSPNYPTPTFGPGTLFYMYAARSLTASASNQNAFSIWFDWDQNGEFDAVNVFGNNELILTETTSVPLNSMGAPINNTVDYSVTIPGAANFCNGPITGRIMAKAVSSGAIGPPPCDEVQVRGETEDFEIIVGGGVSGGLCAYPPKGVNCNILNPLTTGFQVNCADKYGAPINGIYNFKVVQ